MNELKNQTQEEEKLDTPFNGSLDTLSRINLLIQDIIESRVNSNWLVMKENLGELLNESQGCLTKDEYTKAWKDWGIIESYQINIDDEGYLIYDDNIPSLLQKFSSWLRLKLYKHNLTMAKTGHQFDKFNSLYKRYKI